MGRTLQHDGSKTLGSFASSSEKRGLLGVGSGSNFPDIIGPGNSLFGTACCNSSQQRRNGEVFSSNSSRIGYPSGRDTGALDSSVSINGPASLLSAVSASFGNLTGDPHRGFSEPLSNLSSATGSGQSNRKSDASIEALARAVALIQKAEFAHLSIRAPSTAIPNSGGGLNLDPLEFPPILPSSGRKVTGPNSSASPPVTKTRSYVYHLSKGLASGGMDNASSGSVHPPHLSDYVEFPALPFTAPGSTGLLSPTSVPTTASASISSNMLPTSSISSSLSSISTQPRHLPHTNMNATNQLARQQQQTISQNTLPSVSLTQAPSIAPGATFVQSTPHSNVVGASGSSSGLQLLQNHYVANIPKNMICDQFGMIGLLKLIRVGDYDATLNMLAPGLDLTTLNINWHMSSELYNSFVSPFHDQCMGRPQDLDYVVPPEYLIRNLIADHLPDPLMDQLSDEILFWLFYQCCREEIQLVAAKELYQRDWRFHKKEGVWLTRMSGVEFTTDANSEQGYYYFWDQMSAQKLMRQMTIFYTDLDNVPLFLRIHSPHLSSSVSFAPVSPHSVMTAAAASASQPSQSQPTQASGPTVGGNSSASVAAAAALAAAAAAASNPSQGSPAASAGGGGGGSGSGSSGVGVGAANTGSQSQPGSLAAAALAAAAALSQTQGHHSGSVHHHPASVHAQQQQHARAQQATAHLHQQQQHLRQQQQSSLHQQQQQAAIAAAAFHHQQQQFQQQQQFHSQSQSQHPSSTGSVLQLQQNQTSNAPCSHSSQTSSSSQQPGQQMMSSSGMSIALFNDIFNSRVVSKERPNQLLKSCTEPVAFQGHINKTAAAAYLASMNGNPGGALTTATAAAVHSSASNAISCPVCSSLGSSSTIHMTISNCGSSVPLVSLSGKDEAGTRSSSSSSSTSAQLSSGLKAVSNIFPTSKASLSSLATTASAGGTTGCNSSPVAVISTAMSNCELNGPIIADLSCSQASLSSTGLPGSSICQTSGLGSTASTGPINRSDIVASTASVSAIASPPDGFGPDGIVVRPASGSDATTNSCNTSGNTGSGQSVLNCRKTSLVETNGSSVSRDLELNYLTS